MKKFLSVLISIAMLCSLAPISAFGESVSAEDAVIYLTINKQGILASDNDGAIMANREITVKDLDANGILSVEEAVLAAHKAHNSEDGYGINDGFVSKLWGMETMGNCLFFLNHSGISSGICEATITDGDYLVASINADNTYYADWYTFFDIPSKTVAPNEAVTLTLKGHLGMAYLPEDLEDVAIPDVSVGVWENGSFTPIEGKVTDETGAVTLSFPNPGVYHITASGTAKDTVTVDWITGETAAVDCPIIPPICTVTVEPEQSETALHTIAKKFLDAGIATDGNMPWFAADLAVYAELFPQSEPLRQAERQRCVDKLIADAASATAPATLAKSILALRAMGYDAKNVYTAELQQLDIVSKLTVLVDERASSVTNIYTLPYVILALQQDDDYATDAQMNFLLTTAINAKASWQNTQWGTDGATPMLLALSPYYTTDETIKAVIDETIPMITALQSDTGSIGNAASTGLAITAFSALGIDAETITKNGKSLIDGLMANAAESLDGFLPATNSFATEQGFRGLLALQLFKTETGKRFYDFSNYPAEKAEATWAEHCPVIFETTPTDAAVTIEGATAVSGNYFDLSEGTYTYSVSKDGYTSATGSLTVTPEDVATHTAKTISISLSVPSGSGGGSADSDKLTIALKIMTHDKNICNNAYTYKYNASAYQPILKETIKLESGQTVYDLLIQALESHSIPYVEGSSGYFSSINGISEFDHGATSGWMFTINGSHITTGCKETPLTSNASVVWFFTDDYTREKGSEGFASSGSGGGGGTIQKPATTATPAPTSIPTPSPTPVSMTAFTFTDVSQNDWHYEAIKYVYENDLMQGTGTEFEPDSEMTRAMLVTVLYRMENPEPTSISSFSDVASGAWYYNAIGWAAEQGIVNGVNDTEFAPDANVSREQMALILYRYAKLKGYTTENTTALTQFADATAISDWALDALCWANASALVQGTGETTIAPQETATRAQVATILMRFCEKMIQ